MCGKLSAASLRLSATGAFAKVATMNEDPDKPIRQEGGHDYLYARIAERLRQAIAGGTFPPGSRLPSLDDLAKLHDVNRLTVRKAVTALAREGLVHTVPAQGTFVSRMGSADGAAPTLPVVGLLSHVLNPAGYGPYHQSILSGIYDELGRCGANLLVMPAGMVKPEDFPGMVRRARTQGMIYLGPFDDAILAAMVRHGPPAVVVDHRADGLDCDSICVDNVVGAAEAMRHLLKRADGGDVAIISGMPGDVSTEERLRGARLALREAGVAESAVDVIPGNYVREGGEAAMLAMIQRGHVPRAVFCLNDEMAVGALNVLLRTGHAVPVDVALSGFDDTVWAQSTHPPLTSVHVDTKRMGKLAMNLLWARMHDGAAIPACSTSTAATSCSIRTATRATGTPAPTT